MTTANKTVVGYVNVGMRDFKQGLAFYRDVLGLSVRIADEAFSYASFDTGAVPFAIAGGGEDKGAREDRHTASRSVCPMSTRPIANFPHKGCVSR